MPQPLSSNTDAKTNPQAGKTAPARPAKTAPTPAAKTTPAANGAPAARPTPAAPAADDKLPRKKTAVAAAAATSAAAAPTTAAKAPPQNPPAKTPPPKSAANKTKPQQPADAEDEEDEEDDDFDDHPSRAGQMVAVYLVSTLLHAVVLGVMGLFYIDNEQSKDDFGIISSTTIDSDSEEPLESIEEPLEEPVEQPEPTDVVVADTPVVTESPVSIDISDLKPAMPEAPATDLGSGPALPKGEFGGRTEAGKKALLVAQGGNTASEEAVATGLKWLALHQRPNGSWSYKHASVHNCAASCTSEGNLGDEADIGATGHALLAFLGAGHTHERGQYQPVVEKGLSWLLQQIVVTPDGGNLCDNFGHGMYLQGIATIALCEAYALSSEGLLDKGEGGSKTKKTAATRTSSQMDYRKKLEAHKKLQQGAQLAVNYIVRAQDPKGGGWAYTPRSGGDTSVVGWQFMALKSAKAAKLQVPSICFEGTSHYLNFVQANDGANYGYRSSEPNRPACSAIGLLCRMYLGWKSDHPGLQKGVAYLAKVGPSADMYYNYYATQVLHHWGGDVWKDWNEKNRDRLVARQTKTGHAAGSWPVGGGHGGSGGRHYETCMVIMTLEVYYRHLPIYQREGLDF